MENKKARGIVAVALAATGILHLILTPEYLEEETYLGVLFIAGGLTSIGLAGVIWKHGDARAIALGVAIALGMGVGFVLSRTVGLPGFYEEEWELSGLISLALEAAVIAGGIQLFADRGARQLAR